MNDFEALVLLNMVPSLGSISISRLLNAFDKPQEVFDASPEKLSGVEGITARKISEIKKARKSVNLERELKLAKDSGINIITILDDNYPENLKNIYDPPAVLYVKGEFLDCDYNSVGVVGSRRASFYGLSTASRLSAELSGLGLTIVSGLARGIDTASHKGALSANGRTIAVLGSGLLKMYPPENEKLAEEISKNGAVISEFSLETPPLARNFPRRNRIISGLCLGIVIVEAARNSGALITADSALQQGREVFAVPGKMDSFTSVGTHNLIKQGAKLISNSQDIMEELVIKLKQFSETKEDKSVAAKDNTKKQNAILDKEADSVYKILSQEPQHIDEIINLTNMNVSQISSILMKLQLTNMAKELPGKNFVRV
ncbi:MAG: DNA-processing protein DprA [Candidatus Omnitrophica bacterium]|nr:DNA-processing protein DprA [Candidatus Omnitrophota bacterium]MDD5351827.1 DNA-processing protein DprA [Candidatus Omnitrophota bacterium]MDD5550653.1 DNA-processing protein DprA [Candidatus Omnitrophota bacterium]